MNQGFKSAFSGVEVDLVPEVKPQNNQNTIDGVENLFESQRGERNAGIGPRKMVSELFGDN